MIDHFTAFPPRHPLHHRHRAAPALGSTIAGLRARAGARLSAVGLRAGAWAVTGGLAAASIGMLATVMIANGWHAAPRPQLAAATSAAAVSMPPVYLPHRTFRPPVSRRPRPPRHAPTPLAQPAARAPAQPALSSIIGAWRQAATAPGLAPWFVNIVTARAGHSGGHHTSGRWPGPRSGF